MHPHENHAPRMLCRVAASRLAPALVLFGLVVITAHGNQLSPDAMLGWPFLTDVGAPGGCTRCCGEAFPCVPPRRRSPGPIGAAPPPLLLALQSRSVTTVPTALVASCPTYPPPPPTRVLPVYLCIYLCITISAF
jgi:hypothetical protein